MNLQELLRNLRKEVRRLLPEGGTHGYEHTERVFRLALHIGQRVNADLGILLPAALLHDIGRGEIDHARAGARRAREILGKVGLKPDRIEAVVEAIETHSFSGGREPRTLEAKVLSDADKLDAMGAIGIYRAATYSGEHQRPIEGFIQHFHEKLLRLRELLYTEEARRMAEERHRFMLQYLEQLERELNLET
ncbi:HD domain-containing protein [Candidatus Bathyarchaeota archaeon]|nr:HD domain-containing protein [Candidatus Bathyarchaeota archaeon]